MKSIRTPRLLAVIRNGRLIDGLQPHSETDWETIFDHAKAVIAKPISGSGGFGVCLMNDVKDALSFSASEETIVVQKVEQAAYAHAIFPDSANTIRVVAMRQPVDRRVFIPVDNWSRGGLSCPIDLVSGEIGAGIRHPFMTSWTMKSYERHPDTGAQIAGIRIPNWNRLLDSVFELMSVFPDLEIVAWDLLATEDGWCAIEGNHAMDIDLLQVHGGLLVDERVRTFFAHHCPSVLS